MAIKSRGGGGGRWRGVAQYQITSELSGSCTNITLSSDGITKHSCSYTTFDVINEQGKLLVCGLQDVTVT